MEDAVTEVDILEEMLEEAVVGSREDFEAVMGEMISREAWEAFDLEVKSLVNFLMEDFFEDAKVGEATLNILQENNFRLTREMWLRNCPACFVVILFISSHLFFSNQLTVVHKLSNYQSIYQ